jgi:hypothetical protein
MKTTIATALLTAVIALGLMTACWPAQSYNKNGLSFTYPGSWQIVEDEFESQMGYLQLTRKDSDPQATIIFGWMESDAAIGADMMLGGIIEDMKTGEGLTDVVAEPASDVDFGPYPARAVTYTATQDGVAIAGAVWVFTAEGRVMNVAVREGADAGNARAFKSIRESFSLAKI